MYREAVSYQINVLSAWKFDKNTPTRFYEAETDHLKAGFSRQSMQRARK